VTPLTPARWSARDLVAHLDEVLGVYGSAMNYSAGLVEGRRGILVAHTRRPEFRAVGTLDEDGKVIGFGYGYRGEPGQWWHEHVRSCLDPAGYRAWLSDCFEVVELHVAPEAQGHGIGEEQIRLLLDGVQRRTTVLSTPEGESRAWRLYRRLGYLDVLREIVFPGDDRPFAVLGRGLPLDSSEPLTNPEAGMVDEPGA
jgi:ribosomal protein S18 acetylase RimI-like enzyme